MQPDDRELIGELRLKRLQRAVEYILLTAIHLFFLLAFRDFYQWWMAAALYVVMFSLNFQLTQLRERRRTASPDDRRRVQADVFESLLFLAFIVGLSLAGGAKNWLGVAEQEYLAYVAALLSGLFLAGCIGEIYWQAQHLWTIDEESRRNYVTNLRRTVILPYLALRRRRE